MFGEKLFLRLAVGVFREHLSLCVCVFLSLLDLIVLVPDLAFPFTAQHG